MARAATSRFPAISVRQPGADRILSGDKRRDRRSRPTRFRGWILLHASKAPATVSKSGEGEHERGKLLGIVRLEDCVRDGKGWAYLWSNPRRFRTAIPCRGHYSIPFYVPAGMVEGTPATRVTPGRLAD